MKDSVILQMNKIGKSFPGVIALDDVDFDLREGEVHILLGENGAGKSTLIKILSGAYMKSSGEIYLSDKITEIQSPRHAMELGISVIYQEFNLIPHLTAAENIFLGREEMLKMGVLNKDKMQKEADELLRSLGVKIDSNSLVKNLGIAQKQMIEVAKALSINAKILIMDEPTSALTDNEIKELFATISRLKSQGVSIIYISHRMEELFEIGDRVTVLRDGKLIGVKNINETDKGKLIKMMVDRELKQQYPKQENSVGEEVLRIEHLKQNGVLEDINLTLHKGEILGIAGLLGSGRTELAQAIFGLSNIDSGSIYINGKVQNINSPQKAISLGIGFLTEDRKTQGLVLELSVRENICLPNHDKYSKFGIVSFKDEDDAASHYIKELRIKTPSRDQKVINLSGGNQQKVVLSKWLCSKADIFIFDEPTRGIDVGAKVEIYNLMNQLTAQGVAIIMISSELPEILGMSDRIIVMRKNKIAGGFSSEEATQEKIMSCALGA